MTGLPAEYLDYPLRRPGLDHARYAHANTFARRPIEWPGGARIALLVLPILEWFPLGMERQAVSPPGGLERPHPDYWNFTLRDYGNRVGAFRIFDALDERRLKATVAISSRLVARAPALLRSIVSRGYEVMAHGVDMAHVHHGAMPEGEEAALVHEAFATLRDAAGQPVTGWSSPAQSQSWLTPDIVAQEGGRYVADFINDDVPFALATRTGDPLVALPIAHEVGDLQIFLNYRQRPAQYTEQVVEYFRFLHGEAERHGGRVMTLALHPWLIGVPHRIAAFERALDLILSHPGVWSATGEEIRAAWEAQ